MFFKCVKIKTNVPVQVDRITCIDLSTAEVRCRILERQSVDKDCSWAVLSSEDIRQLKRSGFDFKD